MRIKETFKSILLVLLVGTMLTLLYITWDFVQTGGSNVWLLSSGMGSAVFSPVQPGQSGAVSVSAASYPMSAAARGDGLYGVTRDYAAAALLYDRIRPVLAEALGSAEEPMPVDELSFISALAGGMVYLGYDGQIPLAALGVWAGTESSEPMWRAGPVSRVILSTEQDEIAIYYRSSQTGIPMMAKTAARSRSLTPVFDDFAGNGAFFAVEGGDDYKALPPETLILAEQPRAPRVAAHTPQLQTGTETALAVLRVFGYNSYTARKYGESDGAQVYVENLSTIRITEDGILTFTVPAGQTGVSIEGFADGSDAERQILMIEAARSAVYEIYESFGYTEIYLSRFYFDEQSECWTAVFSCSVSGIPVRFENGRPLAVLQMRNGTIVSAHLYLRRYEAMEQTDVLLPEKQLAALGGEGERNVFYIDRGEDYLEAGWYLEAE